MEHKFKIAVKILNIFIILTLLNSCEGSMNMMSMNGFHGKDSYNKNGEHHKKQMEPAECPCCQGADRNFCRLANGTIILCCDECFSYWLDPKNINRRGAINRYGLEKYFNERIDILFSDKGKKPAGQATGEEVEKSEWKNIAEILT